MSSEDHGILVGGGLITFQPTDYSSLFSLWLGNEAYYLGPNGLPMISTFSSGGFSPATWNSKSLICYLTSTTDADTFQAWKESLDDKIYFVPMFDDTSGYYGSASGVRLVA